MYQISPQIFNSEFCFLPSRIRSEFRRMKSQTKADFTFHPNRMVYHEAIKSENSTVIFLAIDIHTIRGIFPSFYLSANANQMNSSVANQIEFGSTAQTKTIFINLN